MAHYKRGKCRYKGVRSKDTQTFWRARRGLKPVKIPRGIWRDNWEAWRKLWPKEFNLMRSHPRWHDIIYHSRPRRHKDKAECRRVIRGDKCPDEAIWQIDGKPKIYYW